MYYCVMAHTKFNSENFPHFSITLSPGGNLTLPSNIAIQLHMGSPLTVTVSELKNLRS